MKWQTAKVTLAMVAVVMILAVPAQALAYPAQDAADSWGEQICEDSGGLFQADVERGESEWGDTFVVDIQCNDGSFVDGLEFNCWTCEV